MSDQQQPRMALTGVTAIVALAGIVMAAYGVHVAFEKGSAAEGVAWIAAGFLLQVASGAFGLGHGVRRGSGLNNPFRVLNMMLTELRTRIRGWDERR